jgi:hypothetical protein
VGCGYGGALWYFVQPVHARRKKYDGRDGAGEDCRDLVSFAPVEIGEPISEAEPSAVADGGLGAGRMEIICPTGHRVIIGNGDSLKKGLNMAAHRPFPLGAK